MNLPHVRKETWKIEVASKVIFNGGTNTCLRLLSLTWEKNSISTPSDIFIFTQCGTVSESKASSVCYPGGPVRVNRPTSSSSDSPWWALNVHMCRLLSSSKVTSSTWTCQYWTQFKCSWKMIIKRGKLQKAEELLPLPGGEGSEPVWLQHSRHEGPWTPHLELRTWILVKEKPGASPLTHHNKFTRTPPHVRLMLQLLWSSSIDNNYQNQFLCLCNSSL